MQLIKYKVYICHFDNYRQNFSKMWVRKEASINRFINCAYVHRDLLLLVFSACSILVWHASLSRWRAAAAWRSRSIALVTSSWLRTTSRFTAASPWPLPRPAAVFWLAITVLWLADWTAVFSDSFWLAVTKLRPVGCAALGTSFWLDGDEFWVTEAACWLAGCKLPW